MDPNTAPSRTAQEFEQLIGDLHRDFTQNQPIDALQFCANFFHRKLEEQRTHHMAAQTAHPGDTNGIPAPAMIINQDHLMDSDLDEEEAEESEDQPAPLHSLAVPVNYNRGRRTSVSAESMAPSQTRNYTKIVIPKSDDQKKRIEESIQNNFLFKNLDEEQYKDVVNAMSEKRVKNGETIIEQGAVGDYFYMVESGTFDCFISKDGAPPQKVTSYGPGGSFGQLALMYNAPRAATITATSDAVLWALDRVTFRSILMENTSRKRRMYEGFLEVVPILASLEPYERHKIADALESVDFEDGDVVVKQGDVGNNFYIIESGECIVTKTGPDSVEREVNRLEKGGYFGELALINDEPRQATVYARGRLKCATLGKKAFTRLLGPVVDILKRNSENYARFAETL
ncbi:hypothetical protein BZG36_04624 [Bifiguratus adelaidae]|uniref:cAMP-dependent protein kinase regulatory subunit n=1 Tax=Bifiguratus adelaidae TaxID=1938954 RepID=A0A261XX59_9FUNG|nr:hypothetical protein BZG36_04624 [Bifiguratus adelaidae]